ncbi:hypothetical protein CSUI_009635, partial [Cystoisospora suis]
VEWADHVWTICGMACLCCADLCYRLRVPVRSVAFPLSSRV